jgi:uncharacterized protein (DUF2267 family)
MSATGLDVFDRTIHTTNLWLQEIGKELGPDRQHSWKVLSVVLHKLRDRLPVELAAHLGSQLPLLVRGMYYDQYQPAQQPSDCKNLEDFSAEVAEWLADTRPTDPKAAIQAIFGVLSRHLPEGQVTKTRHALPQSLRSAWESVDAGATRH